MKFEWNVEKAEANLAKHKVRFEIVFELDWDVCRIVDDLRFDYGEARYIAYARSESGDRYVVAFTLRSGTYRIISVRRFGRKEYKIYGE